MRTTPAPLSRPRALIAVALIGALGASCDQAPGLCRGPEIEPHLSPVNFGDLFARGAHEEPHPESRVAVPYEWVLLLLSGCSEGLVIDEVCLIGDDHDGVQGDHAFTIEGPIPASVPYGQTAALRLTYDHEAPNTEDADGDGAPDPDQVALVIQSNAVNAPTLVVPLCARIIPKDAEPSSFDCVSPVAVPLGEYRDLCGGAGR